jgi:hypothetical protein
MKWKNLTTTTTGHENGPFYYSDSDEDLGDGDVIDEVRREEEVDPIKYVDPRTRIEKDSLFNMQFPCKIGYMNDKRKGLNILMRKTKGTIVDV